MQITRTAVVSHPCVPVSTSDTPVSNDETQPVTITPHSLNERVYSVSEAINCLIDAGFEVGVDGELLPPHCMVRQLRGLGA